MTRHYIQLTVACVLFISTMLDVVGSENKILLDKPVGMNKTLQGNSKNSWIVARSIEVPGVPYGVYRCSVDVKSQTSSGEVVVMVRQILKSGKSICYSKTAVLSPGLIDFNRHSKVFFGAEDVARLQVYYKLNRVSGFASFRNLVLEKLSVEEGKKALEAMKVPPVYFSLPVYCYSDRKKLNWGYRVNEKLNSQGKKINKIVLECPESKLRTEIVPVKGRQMVNAVNWQFKEGVHYLTAKALDASGKVLARETVSLKSIKRPFRSSSLPIKKVNINKNNVLVVNGKSVFPMGIYHVYTKDQMRQIREQGFNCIQIWHSDLDKFKRNMDWAAEEGLMSWTVPKMVENNRFKKIIIALKNHPANLMWDLVDEPAIRNISPSQVKEKADIIRSIDKSRPIKISFADTTQAAKYEESLDIAATHGYPVPFGKVTDVSKQMDLLSKDFGGRAPVHFTPQSWLHYNDRRMEEQSVAQTRAMTYLAINHGAKGLYYYSFIDHGTWDIRKHPRLWSTFIGLTYEIETLSKIILEGQKIQQVSVLPSTIDFASWEYEGDRYIIAVNTLEKSVDALLSVTDWKKFKLQEMFRDNKPLIYKSKNGFKSKFTPLQTKIFKISRLR